MTTNTNQLNKTIQGLLVAGALAFPACLQAQQTAHYVPGVEGIKGASLPPPGIYLRDYNVAYWADQVNDNLGNKFAEPDVFVYANVPRIIWITDVKVLGGYLGVDALIPLQYTDVPGDSGFGVGDLFAEATWSAHTKRFDFSAGYGIWAPTGGFDVPAQADDAGLGYWTHMFTAGATFYFDENKKWALSALNRYEINMEQRDTDTTIGNAYTLEYGLSYAIHPMIDIGAVGYYQQKVTGDSGARRSGVHDRVAGVGPEVSAFCKKLKLNTSIRYLYEFMAESRLQGHTVALTLTKVF